VLVSSTSSEAYGVLVLLVDVLSEELPEFKADLEELVLLALGVLDHVGESLVETLLQNSSVLVLVLSADFLNHRQVRH